jgi:type I restriction enzyme S subunit
MLDQVAGWRWTKLQQVAHVQNGIAKGKKVSGDSVELPYLRVANVQDGSVDLRLVKTVIVNRDDAARYALQSGDVLFTEGGDFDKLGRGTVWRGQISDCLHQNHIFAVRPHADKLLPEFLAALAASKHGRRYFQLCSKQSTNLASINSTQLKSFPLPLPPLPEQRRIAGILRTWDEAIDAASRLIDAKRRRLAWVRNEILSGKVRMGGCSAPWAEMRLSDVLREHGDYSTGAEEVYSVSVHKGLVNQVEHLGRSFAAKDTSKYNRVHPNDVIYTKSPTGSFPLGIIKRSQAAKDVIVSPLYGVFTPKTPELGLLLDAYFESPIFVGNYLRPLVQKGAKNTIAITNRRFLEGKLLLPRDHAEQKKIAELIVAAREEIAASKTHLDALKRQKRGLMQKLLTGEWRVPA